MTPTTLSTALLIATSCGSSPPSTPEDDAGTNMDGSITDASNSDASDDPDAAGDTDAGPTGFTLAIEQTDPHTLGSLTVYSSTKLRATWSNAPEGVQSFQLRYRDPLTSEVMHAGFANTETAYVVSGLLADASYEFVLRACLDEECTEREMSNTVTASPAEEYWEVSATGDSIDELTRVTDGNSKVHAVAYGEGAGALEGKVQLYYGSSNMTYRGMAIAVSNEEVTSLETASSFTNFTGTNGLISPTSPSSLLAEIMTGKGVPLAESFVPGGRTRLFFEFRGAGDLTRIGHIDSQDASWTGHDFNSDLGSQLCSTTAHYQPAGTCEPIVDIGVEGDDSEHETPGVNNVRQFSIGYPMLDDWRWNGTAGTFMFVTMEMLGECDSMPAPHANQGYAVFDGAEWEVQLQTDGCPYVLEGLQAPSVVHLGGVRYKMYAGNTIDRDGEIEESMFPFLGPKRVVYADGAISGEADIVDFEDWEDDSEAHDINFVWPSGALFSDTEEGYIDDFVFMTPTFDLAFQLAYLIITDGDMFPFAIVAELLNP